MSPLARAIYRLLLVAFPRDMREEHGDDMVQLFADRLRAAPTTSARWRLWVLAVADVGRHAALERAARMQVVWKAPASPRGRRRWIPPMLWRDLRFAARVHTRTPVVTLAAVLTIALGVGANAAIFGFADALLFRPLPVADPDRVVALFHASLDSPGSFSSFSRPDFQDFRVGTASVFAGLAAYEAIEADLGDGDALERLAGEIVSHDYFDVLGLEPAAGRWFTPDEDRVPGAAPVAVISHALWSRRYAADAAAVGETLLIDGRPFTVVGVAPAAFRGLDVYRSPDVWVPVMMYGTVIPWMNSADPPLFDNRTTHWLNLVARLHPGVTVGEAEAALKTIADRQNREVSAIVPDWRWSVRVVPVNDARTGSPGEERLSRLTALLAAVVALVLLIACANVANLLLARSLARQRELGVRLAVGAGRGAIVRQLLIESLLLSAVGGAVGVLLAVWSIHFLNALELTAMLPSLGMRIDGRVLAFTLLVTGVAGLVFGLLPAWQASRVDLVRSLKSDGPGAPRRSTMRQSLVASQVALCAVLLVGTGLTLRTLAKLYALPLGFDAGRVSIADVDLGPADLDTEAGHRVHQRLVERLAAHPGVEAVSLALTTPFGGLRMANDIFYETGDDLNPRGRVNLDMNVVGPGYFEAMGIGLVRGRTFTWQDREGTPGVAVVNEALAARLWPGLNPIGQRVWFWNPHGEDQPLDVIGVVRDGRYMRAWRGGVQPFMFLASGQMHHATMALVVRAAPGAGPTLAAVRADLRALAPAALVVRLQPVTAVMANAIAEERMSAKLLSLFGLLALVLAGVGIYGAVSLAVAARSREMGVRLALGAPRSQIFTLIVRHGLGPVAAGVAAGAAVALGLARFIASLLFGVTPSDPLTFGSAVTVLVAAGIVASWIPARRATRIDPVLALRAE